MFASMHEVARLVACQLPAWGVRDAHMPPWPLPSPAWQRGQGHRHPLRLLPFDHSTPQEKAVGMQEGQRESTVSMLGAGRAAGTDAGSPQQLRPKGVENGRSFFLRALMLCCSPRAPLRLISFPSTQGSGPVPAFESSAKRIKDASRQTRSGCRPPLFLKSRSGQRRDQHLLLLRPFITSNKHAHISVFALCRHKSTISTLG